MFIRLSTAFVMLFGLTALVGATVPGKRDNVARVAQPAPDLSMPGTRSEPTPK
ncbi:hypothetical protein DFJ58DRAFT_726872 [Suillus subalutaceus]|uniref:uncharacterized protein n=1 Tax=Suillus subalutaceus TaxID=48586 RepID=UPI001B870CAB|nr:uncharacterized protein DFJ58DRAFT_726872 [Suillus subalutaceus]KAG1857748.1 hypothetical protein DFJ58DRAFT_726872 [Suillus subalutaceus]